MHGVGRGERDTETVVVGPTNRVRRLSSVIAMLPAVQRRRRTRGVRVRLAIGHVVQSAGLISDAVMPAMKLPYSVLTHYWAFVLGPHLDCDTGRPRAQLGSSVYPVYLGECHTVRSSSSLRGFAASATLI